MPVYYMNEGAFELPDAGVWDRTTHVLEGPNEQTLVVVRAPLAEGKSLRQVAQLRVLDEMTRISGYSVLEERETAWAGVPVLEILSRWRHEGRAIYQRQAHLVLGGTWMYLALSAPMDVRAEADAWMDRVRDTLRLRSID